MYLSSFRSIGRKSYAKRMSLFRLCANSTTHFCRHRSKTFFDGLKRAFSHSFYKCRFVLLCSYFYFSVRTRQLNLRLFPLPLKSHYRSFHAALTARFCFFLIVSQKTPPIGRPRKQRFVNPKRKKIMPTEEKVDRHKENDMELFFNYLRSFCLTRSAVLWFC